MEQLISEIQDLKTKMEDEKMADVDVMLMSEKIKIRQKKWRLLLLIP